MNIENIIGFDVETIAITQDYRDLDDGLMTTWEYLCDEYYKEDFKRISVSDNIDFYQICWQKYSGLNPLYSKILCLSIGYFDGSEYKFKTLSGDEKEIIDTFFKIIYKFMNNQKFKYIAGHNVKNFDIPYILKRAMINGFNYEDFITPFKIIGRKPWELEHIKDTKEMWAFGSNMFKGTLEEVCVALGIESPKNGEVKGSDIFRYYYLKDDLPQERRLSDIKSYCERDVRSVLEILKRF
jgi:DNA polymerase elongation subunit (family B)